MSKNSPLLIDSVLAAFLAGVLAAWLLIRPVSRELFVAGDDYYALSLYILGACWCIGAAFPLGRDACRLAGSQRAAALLIGVGVLSFAVGDAIWTYYQLGLHEDTPFPSWADAGYLGMYPCLLVGILRLPRRSLPLATRGRVLADSLITLSACVTFSWYFLLGPTIQQGAGSWFAKSLGAGYPIGDLVLLTCLLVLAAQSRDSVPPLVLALLSVGLLSVITADVMFGYKTLKGTYQEGDIPDLLWPVGFLLFGMAMRTLGRVTAADANNRDAALEQRSIIPEAWRSFAPYLLLPALGALSIYTTVHRGDEWLERGVYVGAATTCVLVLIRQGLAISRLVVDLRERVGELELTKGQLIQLAERDGLTGLLNHKAVHARLEAILATRGEAPLSVAMLDLDGFKAINDTYGHPVGDHFLRHVGGSIHGSLGDSAVIGRCGGDEFMVILPLQDANNAASVAESVRASLAQSPFEGPGGERLPLKLCLGIADTLNTTPSALCLVAAADAALYESKRRGGDAMTIHTASTACPDGENTGTVFDALDGLVTAIDNKDRYTRRHSEDVAKYSLILVEALQLSEDTRRAVRVAGLLHDIGKIGIPDSILRKPGKLTDQEYEVMKGHVTLSTLIVHSLPRLSDIIDGIEHHHERWDGTGYPHGLKGSLTPLLGRIMAIADAFSAMTLDRPYRAGIPLSAALAEIERGAGTQFDPTLAELFIEKIREHEGASVGERPLHKAA